jgi:hypothetical protein
MQYCTNKVLVKSIAYIYSRGFQQNLNCIFLKLIQIYTNFRSLSNFLELPKPITKRKRIHRHWVKTDPRSQPPWPGGPWLATGLKAALPSWRNRPSWPTLLVWCGHALERSPRIGQLWRQGCWRRTKYLYSSPAAARARGGCRECGRQLYEDEGASSQPSDGEAAVVDREGSMQRRRGPYGDR